MHSFCALKGQQYSICFLVKDYDGGRINGERMSESFRHRHRFRLSPTNLHKLF